MGIHARSWLLTAAGTVLFAAGAVLLFRALSLPSAPPPTAAESPSSSPSSGPKNSIRGHLFARRDVYAFLDAAKKAEAIADPLQRCLAYPDPPGSHWSQDAVQAYCRYRTHPVMSSDQVLGLLQQGQFTELDRRLASMLQDKLSHPELAGVMDRAYDTWFRNSQLEWRPLLENWKRASPRSAFAYTASGLSYFAMAVEARGKDYMANTPASKVEAMERLVSRADEDLQHALRLDARMTPAYAVMVEAGRYGMGDAYLQQASAAGLRADPANFAIYNALMFVLQPKWGGSVQAMAQAVRSAKGHAPENPLLKLLEEKLLAYQANIDDDDCNAPGRFESYAEVFDQVAVSSQLSKAGYQAESCGHLELSTVYFSEALRFFPEDADVRVHRSYNFNEFDESAWATSEADRLARDDPGNARYVVARGYGFQSQNDYDHAEKDYLAAMKMAPGDGEAVTRLVNLYMDDTQAWDKAWALDERILEMYPNDPYGWLVRAQIQQRQPRKGLKDTADYFEAHFDNSPDMHHELLRMRAAQALQEGKAKTAMK